MRARAATIALGVAMCAVVPMTALAQNTAACVDCPRALPDAPTVTTTTMRGAIVCPVVLDVDVTVVISHESRGDLVVQLEHAGERVELWSTVGGRGHVFGVTIDDEAERPLDNAACGGLEPCAGLYQPESWAFPGMVGQWGSTANRLSAFQGVGDDGPWILRVVDTASGDVGTLISAWVSLECGQALTPTPTSTRVPTATEVPPSATPTPTATATPSRAPTQTATRAPTATATRPPTPAPVWLPLVTRNR